MNTTLLEKRQRGEGAQRRAALLLRDQPNARDRRADALSATDLDRILQGQIGVSLISYHLRKLVELGVIQPVRKETVRGAVQTFYALSRLFEQLTRLHLDGLRKPFHRRDPGVPFAGLDPADLGRMHPAPIRHLLLTEFQFEAGFPQVWPQLAHGGIVKAYARVRHSKGHNLKTLQLRA
jgi:hypothetical protein